MKINANNLKEGNIIQYKDQEGALGVVLTCSHTKPGKGGALIPVTLRCLITGNKMEMRYRSNEKVERVYLDEVPYQYLFTEGRDVTLMHPETFDQRTVSLDQLGDSADFLQEGMTVMISIYEGRCIRVSLPEKVVMEVVEAEPVIKGQTASASYKPARLQNGIRIMIPPYIDPGTKILVNTVDRTYVERVKED